MASGSLLPVDDVVREHNEPQGEDGRIDVDSASSTGDNDSTFGDDGASTSSASVTSSIFGYKYENGRRYHAYREGSYLLPNDEAEQDRLDLHHHIFRLVLGGRLFRAPLTDVQRCLDYGTGTGIWAIDFADETPGAFVVGTDLSPIQPKWVPPNCKFYVDDVESEWLYKPDEAFDYIHGRGMVGSIQDYPALWQTIYQNLKPGGWVEAQEYEAVVFSDDDPSLEKAPNTKQWQELINEASLKFGKKLDSAREHAQMFKEAGFTNVVDDIYKVPIGTWPKKRKFKEVGMFQRENMIMSVDSFTVAMFTRVLQWSLQETQILMAKVKEELRNPKLHMYTKFHYVYGQRPPEQSSDV